MAAAAGRCGRGPCGALCPLLAYLGVGCADCAVLAPGLPQPGLRRSPRCPFHAAAFNLIVLLPLACHTRAVLADPGLAGLYAAGLVLDAWLGPAGRSPAGMAAGGDVANNRVQAAHCIVLLLESLLFGAFVAVVFYDQVVSIVTDKMPLEQLRNRGLKETNREGPCPPTPKLALLREVFGRGFVLCWLFPWSCSPAPGAGPTYSPLPSRYV